MIILILPKKNLKLFFPFPLLTSEVAEIFLENLFVTKSLPLHFLKSFRDLKAIAGGYNSSCEYSHAIKRKIIFVDIKESIK